MHNLGKKLMKWNKKDNDYKKKSLNYKEKKH